MLQESVRAFIRDPIARSFDSAPCRRILPHHGRALDAGRDNGAVAAASTRPYPILRLTGSHVGGTRTHSSFQDGHEEMAPIERDQRPSTVECKLEPHQSTQTRRTHRALLVAGAN